jgi:type I restriction enzyme R subunit
VTPPDDVSPLHADGDDPIPPEPGDDEIVVDNSVMPDITLPSGIAEAPVKYYIQGTPVTVLAERVEYLDENGRLVTESLRDYSRKTIRQHYASLNQFLHRWQAAARKEAIVDELAEAGLLLDPLREEVGKDLDPFDLICHIAFDQPPLTRRDRVANVRKRDVFTRYGPQARAVLEALLDKYQDEGVVSGLDDPRILQIAPFASMGTVPQLIKHFGSRADFERAVHELQTALYQESA